MLVLYNFRLCWPISNSFVLHSLIMLEVLGLLLCFKSVFSLSCCYDNKDVMGYDLTSYRMDNVPSIEDCVDYCAQSVPGCEAVVWKKYDPFR